MLLTTAVRRDTQMMGTPCTKVCSADRRGVHVQSVQRGPRAPAAAAAAARSCTSSRSRRGAGAYWSLLEPAHADVTTTTSLPARRRDPRWLGWEGTVGGCCWGPRASRRGRRGWRRPSKALCHAPYPSSEYHCSLSL